jgi:hypothetical protein
VPQALLVGSDVPFRVVELEHQADPGELGAGRVGLRDLPLPALRADDPLRLAACPTGLGTRRAGGRAGTGLHPLLGSCIACQAVTVTAAGSGTPAPGEGSDRHEGRSPDGDGG